MGTLAIAQEYIVKINQLCLLVSISFFVNVYSINVSSRAVMLTQNMLGICQGSLFLA